MPLLRALICRCAAPLYGGGIFSHIENLQEVEEALRGTNYLKELYPYDLQCFTDR